jgi:phosphonate transport system substrate-binding protein
MAKELNPGTAAPVEEDSLLLGLARAFFALGALCAFAPAALAQSGELVFGVLPYLSPTQAVEQYSPLKNHLARALGRPLTLTTAPDFQAFVDRTRLGEYDIAFTAPHMGRLAQKRDGMRVVAQTGHNISVAVIARKNSGIHSLGDLRGRSMAIGSRTSMVYQIVAEALQQKRLVLNSDVRIIDTASFSNLLEAVASGEADAGTIGAAMWETAPAAQKRDLVEVFRSSPRPGFFLLAHPRLGDATIRRVQAAAFAFKDPAEGQAFFKRTQMVDFRAVDDKALRSVDSYGAVFTSPP